MSAVLTEQIERFLYMTGALGYMRRFEDTLPYVLMILGAVLLFFGFYASRPVFSVIVFALTAELIILMAGGRGIWGHVVTAFTMLGGFLAMVCFCRPKLTAFGVTAFYAAWIFYARSGVLWLSLLLAAALGLIAWFFPVLILSLISAVSGGMLLSELVPPYFPGQWLLLTAGGLFLQLFLSRKQTLYEKRRPEALTEYMEKRKQRRRHEESPA